jgi:hypothetical protein
VQRVYVSATVWQPSTVHAGEQKQETEDRIIASIFSRIQVC